MSKIKDKDRWIEQVIASAEGILPVNPPIYLHEKIITALIQPVAEIRLSAKTKWIAAAAIALLLTFNFLIYRQYGNREIVETLTTDFSDEYLWLPSNLDI